MAATSTYPEIIDLLSSDDEDVGIPVPSANAPRANAPPPQSKLSVSRPTVNAATSYGFKPSAYATKSTGASDSKRLKEPLHELDPPEVVGASEGEIQGAVKATKDAVERNRKIEARANATESVITSAVVNGEHAVAKARSMETSRRRSESGSPNHMTGIDTSEPDVAVDVDIASHTEGGDEDEVDGAEADGADGEVEDYDDVDEDDMFEDIMEMISSDDDSIAEPSQLPEHRSIINDLHEKGIHEFVKDYLESGRYTAAQLCAAFGLEIQDVFEEREDYDDVCLRLLGKLLLRELKRRLKLPQYNTLDDAVELLKKARNILVLTGAGISTSLGIPDFRSSNGLYAQLAESGLADKVDDPQDVFSLNVFRDDPTIFYAVARSILSSDKKYSPTHAFIRLLEQKGKLLTNFTQNIDNLEAAAGIPPSKLVHCHGSFASATCQKCGKRVPGDDIHDEIRSGAVPRCKACLSQLAHLRAGGGMKRKRSSNGVPTKKRHNKNKLADWEEDSEDDDIQDTSDEAAGVMKPDIIFFGEDLPAEFHNRAMRDKDEVDLVIVMGSSLKVAPVSELPNFVPPDVPQIYVSRDPCKHINFDIELLGDCDLVVEELCRRAGWSMSHEMLPGGRVGGDIEERSAWRKADVSMVEGRESRWQIRPSEERVERAKAEKAERERCGN